MASLVVNVVEDGYAICVEVERNSCLCLGIAGSSWCPRYGQGPNELQEAYIDWYQNWHSSCSEKEDIDWSNGQSW